MKWILLFISVLCFPARAYDPELRGARVLTDNTLGEAQGGAFFEGKIYLYGDLTEAVPRVGILREYDRSLRPTGRAVRLTCNDKPLLIHPSGLSFHPRWGALLSDTWKKKGVLYLLDWKRAWTDGNLDHAVRRRIEDDAAVNGARAIFVRRAGRDAIASADYGDLTPQLRLYDPERLFSARRTSEPGVLLDRIAVGPFNQNLFWEDGRIVLVQNVTAGLGWRLDTLDLEKARKAESAESPGVRIERATFAPRDELEGWLRLPDGKQLFITSSRTRNLWLY